MATRILTLDELVALNKAAALNGAAALNKAAAPNKAAALDEIANEPVGGKAEGLARLRGMGLRVPDARVLVGAQVGYLPSGLAELITELGDVPLAVRSSALGEDGAETSFAGQYETILDVRGEPALREAIEACLLSAENDRATAYREAREIYDAETGASGVAAPVMSVVVQRMVDARASGVCFTVDPVTNRRNRLVIDSVRGLGEALVSGLASPDHDELQREQHVWESTDLSSEEASPVLSQEEREWIAREALKAEANVGEPLDLEWAIDSEGELFWLQARPITTLGLDPQSLDTHSSEPSDVYTRCNVGEMMPGAVSPLTFSTCARGIDLGWMRIMESVGVARTTTSDSCYIGMSHGHLFINLSEGSRFSSAVMGSSPDQQSLAICGRLVPEVKAIPVPSLSTRLPRIFKQVFAVLRPKPRLRRMEALLARGAMSVGASSRESWERIDAKKDDLNEAYELHLIVSSGAGALAPILLRRLAGEGEPTDEHHAVVASLLAGAEGVESADIAEGIEAILDALVAARETSAAFIDLERGEAIAWLESEAAGSAQPLWRDYLFRHHHRSLRELDIRQPEWGYDPTPLVRSLQTQLRGRIASQGEDGSPARNSKVRPASRLAPLPGAEQFKRIQGIAHAAVRNRERGKSLLVGLTAHFKRAYRALAAQLVAEGRLPDADAIYFLLHEEIGELTRAEANTFSAYHALAITRREALAYQETLSFPEVAVGLPQPEPKATGTGDEREVVGKPVSRGRVEGRVRVVHTLEEAETLQPGEILVAPITDVGWTPYFAIIAGLVTDVGSAVSHGAVVAREYGLPAVLNTRIGTSVLRTGERVILDGDRGLITRLDLVEAPDKGDPESS